MERKRRPRNFYNGNNGFQNGYDHDQHVTRGVNEGFTVIENGIHQRDEYGQPKDDFNVVIDERHLMQLSDLRSWEKITTFIKAQYALSRTRRKEINSR